MNSDILQYTNLLLLFSIAYFFIPHGLKRSSMEYILVSLLLLSIFFSQLFWSDPVQNSTIHKMDAMVAKIVIFSFILYTLVYKFRASYLVVLFALGLTFYWSHTYSSQEWCSDKHIVCHGMFHFCCFIATFFAFVPV